MEKHFDIPLDACPQAELDDNEEHDMHISRQQIQQSDENGEQRRERAIKDAKKSRVKGRARFEQTGEKAVL